MDSTNSNQQQLQSRQDQNFLPFQLIVKILEWLLPEQVCKFRRLSIAFRDALSSKVFIAENLIQTIANLNTQAKESHSPRSYDRLFFTWHDTMFQETYCELHMRHLKKLQWNSIPLCASIPHAIRGLVFLESLCLSHAKLKGELPVALSELLLLKVLDFRWNQLEGIIPACLGKLTQLRELWLLQNKLVGTIPVELGKLKHLRVLAVGNNQLSGPIPVELSQATQLTYLSVEGNSLTGAVPESLSSLRHLTIVALKRK